MKKFGYIELLESLLSLNSRYSRQISVSLAGNSVMGRLIPSVYVGEGDSRLLVVAAMHGREAITSAFIMRSLHELLSKDSFPKGKRLCVVPMLNPDGVEIALGRDIAAAEKLRLSAPSLFKNNADNVNLNANFPYLFNRVPKSRRGGSAPASEPETKALIKLCLEEEFSSAISLHARGNCIFWRDKGNGETAGDKRLTECLRKCCGLEPIAPTEKVEAYSGGFENWFRCRFKKPALCVELVKDEETEFSCLWEDFEDAVVWEKTGHLLEAYLNFS